MSSAAILIVMGGLFLGLGYMGVPVAFAIMAGIGFASLNIADTTAGRRVVDREHRSAHSRNHRSTACRHHRHQGARGRVRQARAVLSRPRSR